MALRVIEVVTPRSDKDEVKKSLEEQQTDEGYVFWASPLDDGESLSFRLVLDMQETENVLDRLEQLFAWTDKYRIVVYPAEATLPRLDKLAMDEEREKDPFGDKERPRNGRISREELYADVLDTTLLSKHYVILVLLSALVGVIGLLRDNVAIIIGAMVLAPLLGPNVGLALAATLGDARLSRESLKTLAVGVFLCLALSASAGLFLGVPELTPELAARSVTSYSDIILAMVSGAAGIISVTLGVPTSLVGVMVALSLLPPLIACGLFLGAGLFPEAGGAGLLFAANVICLNLAGVGTFLAQGIRPLSWYEKERANKATLRAAIIWTVLLAVLVGLMFLRTR
ncbi:TIGR00341 family protein [Pseudodesulfovibrio thermohalotolerans]|uniref:TIGR00341 family protein n=1 Tax=Pseudodesulfovibrio thermohalotolerans TaxID=2880651 RepID=UPI0024420DDE|nr:TIGR00341 family protein [Pseudodesulfovibrio thermohalotolerans]WFS61879.1 TIGR00341 family protein [Pseudodesulfovibrio thermohalotolerans]